MRIVSLGDLLFMQNIITTNYDNHCVILWYYFMEQLSYIWSILTGYLGGTWVYSIDYIIIQGEVFITQ